MVPQVPDISTMFQEYLNSFLTLLDQPWMIWVYGGIIIGAWIGTILTGYFFRRRLVLFILTVALSYLMVGLCSIMIFRIMAHPAADSSTTDAATDTGDQIVVYHRVVTTPTPTPTPEPRPWWWPF